MKRAAYCLLPAIITTLLAAAPVLAQTSTKMMVGKWQLSPEKTAAAAKEAGIGAQVADLFSKNEFSYQIEFSTDGKLALDINFGGSKSQQSGTWKVLDEGRGKVTIELAFEQEGNPSPEQKVEVTFPDANTAKMHVPSAKQLIVFTRIAEEK